MNEESSKEDFEPIKDAIREGLSKKEEKPEEDNIKKGVDLIAIAKELARRHMKKKKSQ